MLGARGIYFGGYPWRDLGILTASDLNAAIALALQEPSTPEDVVGSIPDGSISSSKLMYPYVMIGSTNIPLGPSNITTLTGISPPVNPTDVATKYYVDNVVGLEGYTAGIGLNLIGNQFNIAPTGVVAAGYGTPSTVPQLTVNAQGQITSAGNVPIAISAAQITNGATGTGPLVLQNGPTVQGFMQVNGSLGIGVQPPSTAQNMLICGPGTPGNSNAVCAGNFATNAYYDGVYWRFLANGPAWLFTGGSQSWEWLYGGIGSPGGEAQFGNVCMSLNGVGALWIPGSFSVGNGITINGPSGAGAVSLNIVGGSVAMAGNLSVSGSSAFGNPITVNGPATFGSWWLSNQVYCAQTGGNGFFLQTGGGQYSLAMQNGYDPAISFTGGAGTFGLCWMYSGGNMYIGGTLSEGSDARRKTNIQAIEHGIGLVRQLQPKSFERTTPRDALTPPSVEWGFVAQDVQESIPEAVSELRAHPSDEESVLAISPTAILAAITFAVKQLDHRCAALEAHNGIDPPPEHLA